MANNDDNFPFEKWRKRIQKWEVCPLPQKIELQTDAKVLVVAPHPDDETFACGGTIATLIEKNCHVKVVIVTDGRKGDPLHYCGDRDVVVCRKDEALAALNILGVKHEDVHFFNQPDSRYKNTPEVVGLFSDLLDTFQPEGLLIPSVLDFHRDHIGVALTMIELWRNRGYKERLFLYEAWESVPATGLVDITGVYGLKTKASYCYCLPLRYLDYIAAGDGMATYRGTYLSATSDNDKQQYYAEAFLELYKDSWPLVVEDLLNIRAFQEKILALTTRKIPCSKMKRSS